VLDTLRDMGELMGEELDKQSAHVDDINQHVGSLGIRQGLMYSACPVMLPSFQTLVS